MSSRFDFAVESTGDPLRQCALMLHSVRPDDRKWLLSNLNGSGTTELEQLLGELEGLGIPADARIAQGALRRASALTKSTAPAASSSPPAANANANANPIECLRRSQVPELWQVLRYEPAGLIAHVLSICPASEREAVLANFNSAQRRQIKECMVARTTRTAAGGVAPRSLQVLREEVSLRLARLAGAAQPSVSPAGSSRWKLKLSRLREVLS
jgi:hypothetical protein